MVINNLLVVSTFALFIGFSAGCSNGWLTHGDTCYLFSHDTEEWYTSLLMCRDFGGQLVEIETEAENTFLASQAKLFGSPVYWIALNDIEEEGTWTWMNSKTPLASTGYSNWGPGEPNSSGGGDENCAVFWGNDEWNDTPCHSYYRFICEKSNEINEVIG